MISRIFKLFLLFCICTLFTVCEKKPEKQGVVNNAAENYSYESDNYLYGSEFTENHATELEKFLLGSWYMKEETNPGRNRKGVIIRSIYFDSLYNMSFSKDSIEEPGFIFTELKGDDLLGVKAHWTADKGIVNFSRVLYFSLWDPEYIYNFYKNDYYDETWEIEVTDQDKINIKMNGYDGEYIAQYVRETGREIRELIDNDNVKELEQYLRDGASINERLIYNLTPLMYAIYNKKIKYALFLLQRGADLTLRCDFGYAPIHYAVIRSVYEDEILINVLKKNTDVNIKDDFDQTALDLSILDRQTDNNRNLQKLLYENGAVCTKDEWMLEIEANIQ